MEQLLEQLAQVSRDLHGHSEATRVEWFRAIHEGFQTAQEKDDFFRAWDASSEHFRKLLDQKFRLEREIAGMRAG